jgi:hypothetical protein
MSDATFSFVFDRASALQAFKQIGVKEMLLAALASMQPEAAWDGCLVYLGPTPLAEVATVCVGTRGPSADQVQLRIIQALELHGVKILEVYEGGPEASEKIALVRQGVWATPD